MSTKTSEMERSGQKTGWEGAERWADIPDNAWAGTERGAGGHGAESGCHKNKFERWAANRPLMHAPIRSHALVTRACLIFGLSYLKYMNSLLDRHRRQ